MTRAVRVLVHQKGCGCGIFGIFDSLVFGGCEIRLLHALTQRLPLVSTVPMLHPLFSLVCTNRYNADTADMEEGQIAKHDKLKEQSKPFIDWLQTADSETESDED